jgi:hypothetical protein
MDCPDRGIERLHTIGVLVKQIAERRGVDPRSLIRFEGHRDQHRANLPIRVDSL